MRPAGQTPPESIPPVVAMPARPTVPVQPEKILPAFKIPPLPRTIDLDEEIREAFLADASDLMERIEPLVLGLGHAADPGQSLGELGRCFHTLKGAAGSVGLADLATLVHVLEEHLEMASGPAPAGLIDVLHQTLGYLDGLIGLLRDRSASVGSHDQTPTDDQDRGGVASASPSTINELDLVAPVVAALVSNQVPSSGQESSAEAAGDGPIRVPASRFDELMDLVSELITRRQLWSAQAGSLKSVSIAVRNCRSRMLACPGPAARSRPGPREPITAARGRVGLTRSDAAARRAGRRPGGAGRNGAGGGSASGRSRRCAGPSDAPALG